MIIIRLPKRLICLSGDNDTSFAKILSRMKFLLRTTYRCLFLLLISVVHTVTAQAVKWDSTATPDVYPSQVELFNALPHSKKDIVFLGNSITFWGKWDALFKSSHLRNRGIAGDMTFGVLRRLDEVIQGKPAKVFILIGINDLGRNIPDSIILRNHLRMVKRIKAGSPQTRIYLQTLLPTNDTFNKLKHLYFKEGHISFINQELKRIAAEENVTWVDLHSHFTDENGRLKKEYTWDGVHLTLAGYRAWARVLHEGKYLKAKLR
jgi:lysophospholipase L1-like esterase